MQWEVPGTSQLPALDYPLNTFYRILVYSAETGAYLTYASYAVNWAGKSQSNGFTASRTVSGLTPNTRYTFNLSCTNYEPDAPYVTGWSYNNWRVPDDTGLVATTLPSAPAAPDLTLANVQVTNTSVLVRFGDAASRPPPNAYLNPIERYRLQLEDLDTHLNSTLVTLPPYDAGGAPSAAYGTSGALFVGPAADAPATLSVTFDLSAVSNVPLEPADDYRIRVQAANSEGWGPYSTWLHIHTVHRPEAPSGLSLIAKSGRSIQVGWTSSNASQLHCATTACLVGYRVEVTIDGETATHIVPPSNYAPSYTTTPPLEDYHTEVAVRVCAENAYGCGPYSSPLSVTSDPGPPTVGSVSSSHRPAPRTALRFGWVVGNVDDNGSPVDQFELLLCESATSSVPLNSNTGCGTLAATAVVACPSSGWCYSPSSWYDSGADVFTPGSFYRLRVRANSSAFPAFAQSPLSTSTTVRNYELPYAPLAAARKDDNGGVNNITNLWIEWSAPASSYPAVTSHRIQYEVDGAPQADVLPSNDEWRFERLPASATITLRVMNYNAIGGSAWGPNATFVTAAPQPPEAPGAPERGVLYEQDGVSNVTAIALKWEAAPSLAVPVLEYWLEMEWDGGQHSMRVPTSGVMTFAQVSGLDNGTAYTFTVRARNEAGWGRDSAPTTLHTWPGRPPQAAAAPTLCSNGLYSSDYSTATSVYVGFRPPYDFEQAITAYRIEWTPPTASGSDSLHVDAGRTGSGRTCRILPPYCSVGASTDTAGCLAPSTAYNISVRARNAEGWGAASPPLHFTAADGTPPGTPDAVLDGELYPGASNITAIAIRWVAPRSLLSIESYRIYRNGSLIDEPRGFTLSRQYNMPPGSVFAFQIEAVSAYGASDRSPPTYLRTQPSRPPDAPTLFEGATPTRYHPQTAVALDWEQPSHYDQTGSHLDRYELLACGPLGTGGGCVNYTRRAKYTSFLHTSLWPGATYTYTVRARGEYGGEEVGWSLWSEPLNVTTAAATLPLAPAVGGTYGLRVQNRPWWSPATSIRLAWSAPANYWLGIDHYYLDLDGDTPPLDVQTSLSYVHRGLVPNRTYAYRVRACADFDGSTLCSNFSGVLDATTAAPEPPAAAYQLSSSGSDLCCGLYNVTSTRLNWISRASDVPIAYYYVYLHGNESHPTAAYDAGCASCRVKASARGGYTLTGLPGGSSANWTVQAVNSIGQSSPFAPMATLTLAPPRRPDPPSSLRLGGAIGGLSPARYLSIAWETPRSHGLYVSNYRVLVNEGLADESTHTTGSGARQFVLQPLTFDTNYTFRVAAYNLAGWSEYSAPFLASTATPLPPPTPHNLRSGELCCSFLPQTALALRWSVANADAGISHYVVTINNTRTVTTTGAGYTLIRLFPNATTSISVAAVDVLGQASAPSPDVNFTTAPPRVPGTPTDVRQLPPVSGLSPAITLVASWERPDQYGLPIEFYTAYIATLDDDGAPIATENITFAGWRASYTLFERRPLTNYTIALQATNSLGAGGVSDPVLLSTSDGTVPAKPDRPRRGSQLARVSDVTTFFVTWRPSYSPAYSITDFRIEAYALPRNATRALAQEVATNGSAATFQTTLGFKTTYLYRCGEGEFARCEPQSTVAFRVAAYNVQGWSDWSELLVLTSEALRPPYQPAPVTGRISSNYWLSRGWLIVSWLPPYNDGMEITSYEVNVTNNMGDGRAAWHVGNMGNHRPCSTATCIMQLDQTSVNIAVFQPLDERVVSVRAFNGMWSEWSPPVNLISNGPAAPRKMQAVTRSDHLRPHGRNNCTSITVQWIEASSATQGIARYELRMDGDDSKIQQYPGSNARTGSYSVAPGTTHCFEVRAWNYFRGEIYNASVWSDSVCYTSQLPGMPFTPRQVQKFHIPGMDNATHIYIGWRADDVCNMVTKAALEIDDNPEAIVLPKQSDCLAQYPVAPLLPGSTHKFRVRGFNLNGWGNWSSPSFFTTEPAAPAEPARPPDILNLNATTVELLLPHPFPNGLPLTMLSVQSLQHDEVVDTYMIPLDADAAANATTRAFERAGFNTSLAFRYAGVNDKGTGVYSAAVIAGNEITFEPAAPAAATLLALAPRAANISFVLPTTANNPGAMGVPIIVSRVDVQVEAAGRPIIVHQLGSGALAAQCADLTCTFAMGTLSPATDYSVRLVAWSIDGASPMSAALQFGTPADVPDPVGHVLPLVLGHAAGETSDRMQVAWEAPASTNGRALSEVRVHVCVWPAGAQCVTRVVTDSATAETTVVGLSVGTNYTVLVEAMNEMGSSGNASAPEPPYTTFDVPLEPGEPSLGPPLPGLPNTTTIHAVWAPPYGNGLPLTQYDLIVDGVALTLDATDSYPQQVYTNLYPGTAHNLSVRALNAKGPGPFSPTATFRTADATPGAPTGLDAEAADSGATLRVHVERAEYGGGPEVDAYTIEWKSGRAASQWQVVPAVGTRSVTPSTPFPLTVDIARPRLDLEYRFRARAHNALGAGAWSAEARVLASNADPPPAPLNLTVIPGSVTPGAVQLAWRMPPGPNNTLHGISYYTIELKPARDSSDATTVDATIGAAQLVGASSSSVDLECATTCAAVVSGLQPAVRYLVHIEAINNGANGFSLGSLPSNGVNVTTLATNPDAVATLSVAVAPVLTDASATNLTFYFERPSPNGAPLEAYALVVTDAQSGAQHTHDVPADATHASLVGVLAAGRNYTATLTARNAIGPSAATALSRVAPAHYSPISGQVTTPSVPRPATPVRYASPKLDGLDVTTTVHVMWTPPYDNGVAISVYDLEIDGNRTVELPPMAQPQFVLSGVLPGTPHTFRVRARNAYGVDAWSQTALLETNASVPGAPLEPTVEHQSHVRIIVRVLPASYSGGAAVDEYEVQWCENTGSGCWQAGTASLTGDATLTPPATAGNAMVYELPQGRVAGYDYQFRARAHSAHGWSTWSDTLLVLPLAGTADAPAVVRDVHFGEWQNASTGAWCHAVTWTASPSAAQAVVTSEFAYRVGISCTYHDAAASRDVAVAPAWLTLGVPPYDCPADACAACADDLLPGGQVTCGASVIAQNRFGAANAQTAPERLLFSNAPQPPSEVVDVARGTDYLVANWSAPESYGASTTQYRVVVTAVADGSTAQELVTYDSTVRVDGLSAGADYRVAVQAHNVYNWSEWSAPALVSTFARPDRPAAVGYAPDVPHADKITTLHLAWALPEAHGLPLLDQQLMIDGNVSTLPNATTGQTLEGLAANTRSSVRVRARNAIGWSDWSAEAYLVTDPDVPAADLPPACADITDVHNASRLRYEMLGVELPLAHGNGEVVSLRELHVRRMGNRSVVMSHLAANESTINLLRLASLDFIRAWAYDAVSTPRVLNVTGDVVFSYVDELQAGTCYQLSLVSRNALGWGGMGAPAVCCTDEWVDVSLEFDATPAVITGLTISASLLLLCLLGIAWFAWSQFEQIFGGLNATVFGNKRKRLNDEVDGGKQVQKFMDNAYAIGVDDDPELTVNPVLLHKINMQKQSALRKKRAKIKPGDGVGGSSGGLKRLGFHLEAKTKDAAQGKAKNMVDVEKFLAGQHGVDMKEGTAKKQTAVGKKNMSVLTASQLGGAMGKSDGAMLSPQTGAARAAARAAARGGRLEDEDEDDDGEGAGSPSKSPGAGKSYTAAL